MKKLIKWLSYNARKEKIIEKIDSRYTLPKYHPVTGERYRYNLRVYTYKIYDIFTGIETKMGFPVIFVIPYLPCQSRFSNSLYKLLYDAGEYNRHGKVQEVK